MQVRIDHKTQSVRVDATKTEKQHLERAAMILRSLERIDSPIREAATGAVVQIGTVLAGLNGEIEEPQS